jgi:hypothetical protein
LKKHIDNTREKLGDLGAIAHKTEAAERKILESALTRREAVEAQIKRARAGIAAAPKSTEDRYLDLVSERGQLDVVISRAKKALGE